MIFSGGLHYFTVMAHVVLPVMIVPVGESAGITGLHAMDAQVGIPFVGFIQLLLIVEDVTAGFMVSDNLNAFFTGVAGYLFYIEISIGLSVVKCLRPTPVFPAFVPAFVHHCFYVVGGGKVNISFGIPGGSAVTVVDDPAFHAQMHSPPDAYILHRTYPVRGFQCTRFVQVEDESRVNQSHCFRGNLQGAPGSFKTSSGYAGFYAVGPGSQFGLEVATSGILQCHFGEVRQCGFVDAGVYAACLEGHGSIGIVYLTDRLCTI